MQLFRKLYFQTRSEFHVLIFECDLGHSFILDFLTLHFSVIFVCNPSSIGWCAALLSPSLDPSGRI